MNEEREQAMASAEAREPVSPSKDEVMAGAKVMIRAIARVHKTVAELLSKMADGEEVTHEDERAVVDAAATMEEIVAHVAKTRGETLAQATEYAFKFYDRRLAETLTAVVERMKENEAVDTQESVKAEADVMESQ